MPPAPVSVIVPVRDRRALLSDLLDALDRQTLDDFEVVIVDDGSTDGSDKVAEERAIHGRQVLLVRSSPKGALAARRLGVAKASGAIIAFTDSDCLPTPGWLKAGVGAIEEGAVMANGSTRPQRPLRPFERSVSSGTEGLYPTCNMFFLRETFERFGGLDEEAVRRLGFRAGRRAAGLGFGEDTILAWRIRRSGLLCKFVDDAVVEHFVFAPDLRETLSRALQAAAFPALVKEVPELRGTLLSRRLFLGERRIPVYLALLFLLARRRTAATASICWWVWQRAKELRSLAGSPASNLAWMPAEMGMDVLLAGALLTGSARSRSLVA
jgi:glycosyltransferase involved in cell wall biosynthesis